MAAHNLVSTIVLGFLTPPGVHLLVEDEVVGLHSSEEVTLVAYSARCLLAPYFWGLRVLLVEREAARLSLWLLLAVLGSVVLGVSLFFR